MLRGIYILTGQTAGRQVPASRDLKYDDSGLRIFLFGNGLVQEACNIDKAKVKSI